MINQLDVTVHSEARETANRQSIAAETNRYIVELMQRTAANTAATYAHGNAMRSYVNNGAGYLEASWLTGFDKLRLDSLNLLC